MSYSIRWDIAKLVKAQDFDSCTTLVRIQLSQPTQRGRESVPFVLAGIQMRPGLRCAQALVRIRRSKICKLACKVQSVRITERSGVTQLSNKKALAQASAFLTKSAVGGRNLPLVDEIASR